MADPSLAVEQAVLTTLAAAPIADSVEFAAQCNVDHERLVGVLNSLSADNYVALQPKARSVVTLTDDGEDYLAHGSPEYRVHAAVAASEAAMSMDAVKAAVGAAVYKPGWGKCMRNKWLKFDKAAGAVVCLVRRVLCSYCAVLCHVVM